jgi:hypothetical protein
MRSFCVLIAGVGLSSAWGQTPFVVRSVLASAGSLAADASGGGWTLGEIAVNEASSSSVQGVAGYWSRPVESLYTQWQAQAPFDIGSSTDDPDRDGLPNGVEYALGSSPIIWNTAQVITETTQGTSGLTFLISPGASSMGIFMEQGPFARLDPYVRVSVEATVNLEQGRWTEIFVLRSDPADPLRWRSQSTTPQPIQAQYYRLKVQLDAVPQG